MQTKLRKGESLTLCVRIERITQKWQFNRFSRQRELLHIISMTEVGSVASDPWYVTFTTGQFADGLNQGDEFPITCKFKRGQEYDGNPQMVVNYCKKI